MAITTLLLIPFSFAILGAKMRKKVVMYGITLESKLGFGAGIAGKLSFGLVANPSNNLAFVGTAGFVSFLA